MRRRRDGVTHIDGDARTLSGGVLFFFVVVVIHILLFDCHIFPGFLADWMICMFYQQLQHRRRSFVNGTNRIVGDMVTICQDDIFCNLIGTCHAERSEASEVTPSGWHADAERSEA
jgi:hypothetical protein